MLYYKEPFQSYQYNNFSQISEYFIIRYQFIEEMYKSVSTSKFQNTSFNTPSFLAASSVLYDPTSPTLSKSRKLGVKFDIENDKQNNRKLEDNSQDQVFSRSQKHMKTWTHKIIPSDQLDESQKNPLKQSNFDKSINSNCYDGFNVGSSKNLGKLFESQGFGSLSKKYALNNQLQVQKPLKLQRSNKQCKSMKIIPSYNPDEQQGLTPSTRIKKQRKYQKLQAYNQLLKSSQDLIQKYKKLQQQKTKLKCDLKSQKQSHSKSSKKIQFLQQTESSKIYPKYQNPYNKPQKSYSKFQSSSYLSPSSQIKSPKQHSTYVSSYELNPNYNQSSYLGSYSKSPKPKPLDFSVNLSKYDKYDTKYDNGIKSPYNKDMNKTFTSKSYYNQTSTSELSNKYESKTYGNGFGLTKSSSTKKLGMSGLSLDDFELGKCLGSGAFGQVFPARHKKTNWLFALKKVQKQKVKHMLDQFIQQIKIQLFLDHPNIVKLYSFFDDSLHFYIVMQYMQGGSLYSYLKKQKTLTLEQTSQKLKQVCQGLEHMHSSSVLHRDIKPENIVLCHNVSKLCDFGWSAICKDRRTTYCGTLDYVSPQIIQGEGYDDSVDIWCIGVLAYQLLAGKTPFYNISRKQTMKKIMDCDLQYPSNMPLIAVDFIKKILRKNPQQRKTIQQVLKDPLLKLAPVKKSVL